MFGSMGQSAIKNLGNGGEMDGDVTITGDLEVQGGISLSVDEVIQGTSTIDVTNTEALLVRKNNAGGNVFVVDTDNSRVGVGVTPLHNLTVNNQIGIKRDGTNAYGTLTFDSSGFVIDQSASGYAPLKIKSNGTEIARFTSTGLGIGTASPEEKIHSTGAIVSTGVNGTGATAGTERAFIDLVSNKARIGHFRGTTSAGSGGLQLYTDSVERMSIDASGNATFGGNVGINTDSGGWGLNVKGADANVFKVQASDGNTLSFLQGNGGHATQKWFADGNVTKVFINTDGSSYFTGGSLGIGTASPSALIQIGSNDVANTGLRITNQGVLDAKSIIGFGGSNTQPISAIGGVVESATGNTAGGIYFSTRTSTNNDAPIERMRIDGSGNVGIGTASPEKMLNLSKVSGYADLSLDVYSASTGHNPHLFFRKSSGTTQGTPAVTANGEELGSIFFQGVNSSGSFDGGAEITAVQNGSASSGAVPVDIKFATHSTSKNSNQLVIHHDGGVGIGTASPDHNLDIVSSGNAEFELTRTSGASIFMQSQSAKGLIGTSSNHSLSFLTNGGTRLTIDTSGNATFAGNVTVNGSTTTPMTISADTDKVFTLSSGIGETDNVPTIQTINTAGSALVGFGVRASVINLVTGSAKRLVLDDNSRISLSNNDSGTSNTVFGKLAGDDLASGGNYNSLFGENAGHAVTTGDYNVAIGINSLDGSTNAQRVTAIGTATMRGNATADAIGTVAVGYGALNVLTSGGRNLAIGYQSLDALTEADDNIAIGYQALTASSETQAHRNIAIGGYALSTLNARGQNNIAIGFEALQTANHADVDVNIAIGNYVLDDVGGAGVWACVGIGHNALTSVNNAGAVGSTAIGYYSLSALTSGQANTSVGFQSLKVNQQGDYNTAIGYESLVANIDGGDNTAVGYRALAGLNIDASDTSASFNTAIGARALDGATTGTHNTVIGADAMGSADGAETENTVIGYKAGFTINNGTSNVCIGSQANPSAVNGTNQIVIGKDATGVADNSVTLGNGDVTAVYMSQDKRAKIYSGQIDATMDSSTNGVIAFIRSENNSDYSSSILTIQGDRTTTNNTYNLANFTNAGTPKCVITDGGNLLNTNNSYGAISDEKLKQDIEDANSQWDDIKAVRFRKFKFKDMVEDGYKLGVVAQELEKVSPSLISEAIDRDVDGKDLGTTTKSVKYSILQMKGIVALQEALNRIETLEAKVKELESK
jgi:hypothetical protein